VFGKQDGQLRREVRLRRIGLIQSIKAYGDRDDAPWQGTSHITYVEDRDGRQMRRTRSNGGDVDWLFFVLGRRNLS
jgi:hypothetical protein